MLSFSSRIEGNLMKTVNYLPYKFSIFFQKPLLYSTYWELKMLYQISSQDIKKDFEINIINLAILSKNNIKKKKSLRLFYLRNIPRFSKDVGTIILNN